LFVFLANSPYFFASGQRYMHKEFPPHKLYGITDEGRLLEMILATPVVAKEEGSEMSRGTHAHAQELVGKQIYAVRKDGSVVSGKLVSISGNQLVMEQPKDKKVHTKAIFPLLLFDVLAIGAFDGGFGYGGYGGFDGWW
jgi:hypothetical protein